MSGILQNLFAKVMRRRVERAQSYAELVAQIADGFEPEADDVEQSLAANDKQLADLEKDVARLVRRRELAAEIEASGPAAKERAEILDRTRRLGAALELAKQEFARGMRPLEARVNELDQLERQARLARAGLCQTADAELLRRQKELGARLDVLAGKKSGVKEQLERNRHIAEERRLLAKKGGNNEKAYEEEAARADLRATEQLAGLKVLDAEVEAIEAEQRAVKDLMLIP